MRIGVDLDDTLKDFNSHYLEFYNARHGTAYVRDGIWSYEFCKVFGTTKEVIDASVNDFYESRAFRSIPPYPAALTAIPQLALNHSLYVITARPSHLQELTEEWISKYFPQCFVDVILSGLPFRDNSTYTKGDICASFEITHVIDDSVHTASDCVARNVQVLLVDTPWNQNITPHPRIQRMHSWEEIIAALDAKSL